MSEAMEMTQERPPQEEVKSIGDLARQIVKEHPETYGADGTTPLFKKGHEDGDTVEAIDTKHFMLWIKTTLDEYNKSSSNDEGETLRNKGKWTDKIARLFRRKTEPPPRNTSLSDIDDASLEATIGDFMDYVEEGENGMHVNREQLIKAVEAKRDAKNFDLAA